MIVLRLFPGFVVIIFFRVDILFRENRVVRGKSFPHAGRGVLLPCRYISAQLPQSCAVAKPLVRVGCFAKLTTYFLENYDASDTERYVIGKLSSR